MVNAYAIDRSLPRELYGHGLVIPSSMMVRLEFRRTAYELRGENCSYGYPIGYAEQHHRRQRWSMFALVWANIGAQMIIEHEVES